MIGLLRHGGFIPWDDDVDVALFRPDYEKLIEILANEKDIKMLCWTKNSDFNMWFLKVAKCREDDCKLTNADYIDVFPMDSQYSNKIIRIWKFILRIIISNCIYVRTGVKLRGYRKPLYYFISKFLPRSVIKLHKMVEERTLNSKNFIEYGEVGMLCDQYGEREIMPIEYFGVNGGQYIEYCGVKCKTVNKPEEYLTHLFGKWRNLPPFDERVPKHTIDAPWFYSELR